MDRSAAWAELHEAATPADRLRDIAVEFPEFADAVAEHPHAYPELIAWMRSATTVPDAAPEPEPEPEPERLDELADPGTTPERLMELAQERPDLAAGIAAHPNAYPELVAWLQQSAPPEEPEPLDLEDRITIAAATGAQAFDELGFVFAVLEITSPMLDSIRPLLRTNETLHLALPGILVLAERQDAVALFTDDRLILLWKGGRSLTVPYAEVTAARIGTAPSELAEVLALYLQARDTVIFAVPSDDPAQTDFLAHLVRGVPLAQIRPDLVDGAAPAEGTELAAARAELADAGIAGDRVAALAAAHPELHVDLAGHPRAYPDLLDWLESRPDPRTREAVAARRARDSAGVAPVGASPANAVALPPAYAAAAPVPTAPATTVALPPAYAAAPVSGPNPVAGRSGWERADKALDTADKVADVAFNVAAVIYGIFLIVAGIAIAALLFGAGNGAGFFGILIAIYGVYVALPLPGAKIIIW